MKNTLTLLESHNKKVDRRKFRDGVITSFSTLVFSLIFSFQFYIGGFRDLIFANYFGLFFLVLFVFLILSLLIYPKFNFNVFNPFFLFLMRGIFHLFNNLLLISFYLLTLPFAYFFGRRAFLTKRPELSPWINSAIDFRVSTFRDCRSENEVAGNSSFFKGLFYIFLREKNRFLIIMLVLLLLVSMFILFAQSSVVAPFIYTIF